ncbi:MAG TPA: hypothetical protein DDW51_04630 [Cyanobacteria bacterium UBA11367]|nr:hypothetical protein [Cyanobacteria bacterium UBA11367]HBS68684.1 hypothetical protein [Cyanobacteria bacterium UBA11153]
MKYPASNTELVMIYTYTTALAPLWTVELISEKLFILWLLILDETYVNAIAAFERSRSHPEGSGRADALVSSGTPDALSPYSPPYTLLPTPYALLPTPMEQS